MSNEAVSPGKKVKLEVHSEDASAIRDKGPEFFSALQDKVIQPDGYVLFGGVLVGVQATKPKGPVKVNSNTAMKMSISKKPLVQTCPQCGQAQPQPQLSCQGCGAQLPVVSL